MCKQEGNATFSCTSEFQELTLPDYAVFIVRCILFGVAHSLFAAKRTKQAFSRVAGREPRTYRLLYNMASLAMFGWVMAAYRTSPLLYAAPGIWKWVLYLAQLVVAAAIFRCVRQTGAGDFSASASSVQPSHNPASWPPADGTPVCATRSIFTRPCSWF